MTEAAWLSLIGIGADGEAGLSPAARQLLTEAAVIYGGPRHLAMLPDVPGEKRPWPRPFEAFYPVLPTLRGRKVCVLASGDPFYFGVGSVIAERLAPGEYRCLPAPSSLALAAARLGWAQQEATAVSLHGRPLHRIIPHLTPKARLLVLSWDGTTPANLGALLTARGFGPSRLWVLENLGGPEERITEARADAVPERAFAALNLIALDVAATPDARILPRSPGLPDAWFAHDGQITKRAVRALTLAALAPKPGEVLWDIGAGSGSIGIEWLLAAPTGRVIAIEPRADRAAFIRDNVARFGTPEIEIITGRAPDALIGLPPADAIFVGGGGPEVIAAALAHRPPGARLVANAVTLESQAALIDLHGQHGGQLMQIALAESAPLGPYRGFTPARPLLHWCLA